MPGTHTKAKPIVSCLQCAGIVHCYKTAVPDLTSEECREIAARCLSLHKGISTETVSVEGSLRGVSRKKAERMISSGEAEWIGDKLLKLRR